MNKIILTLLIVLSIMASCSSDESSTTQDLNTEFELEPINNFYKNYYEVNILPSLVSFKIDIEKQVLYTEQFKENATLENLELLQNQWKECAIAYSKTKVYSLGNVKKLFYDLSVYNSPVNTSSIENVVRAKDVEVLSNLRVKSTTVKGLGALEYLLFNNQDTSQSFSLLEEDSYRIDYSLAVTKEVLTQIKNLISFWEDDYKTEFSESNGSSCTKNARCLAFNQIINILDINKVTKVGKPAGLEKSDNITPTLLDAYRSQNSLALIRASLCEIENAYSISEVNFNSIVDDIDSTNKLSNEIALSFKEVYGAIDAINTSLYSAVTDEPNKVETLYNTFTKLNTYFSVDVASLLSVTVLPTDNDGD